MGHTAIRPSGPPVAASFALRSGPFGAPFSKDGEMEGSVPIEGSIPLLVGSTAQGERDAREDLGRHPVVWSPNVPWMEPTEGMNRARRLAFS